MLDSIGPRRSLRANFRNSGRPKKDDTFEVSVYMIENIVRVLQGNNSC